MRKNAPRSMRDVRSSCDWAAMTDASVNNPLRCGAVEDPDVTPYRSAKRGSTGNASVVIRV